MKKVARIIILILFMSMLFVPRVASAEGNTYDELPPKLQVAFNKEWSIKFNAALNKDTVNNKNIIVTDKDGKIISVDVKLDYDEKTIIIGAPPAGYLPESTYCLNVTKNVQGKDGNKLEKEAKMKFTIANDLNSGTSNEKLPGVAEVQFNHKPIISDETQEIVLTAKSSDKVQYRVFTKDYKTGSCQEVTKGYTEPVDGDSPFKLTFSKTLKEEEKIEGKKYKLLVYIKRANMDGANKDTNTEYDTYYVDYFKCVANINTNDFPTVAYNKSMKDFVKVQMGNGVTDEEGKFMKASENQLSYYLNPENFLDQYGKYQFLKLNYTEGITADNLNSILNGKGVLENKGEVFLQAAKENDISAVYLVSHALLETGGGTSALANGIEVKDLAGNPVQEPKITYNMFGIKAIDGNANKGGSEYAYTQGWFTVDDAIVGGAKFISSQYINNTVYKQDTLYEMRWNPNKPGVHQYATDIGWAYKQIKNIKNLLERCENAVTNFEVPVFNKN